jgi:hypothetical protein
MNYTTQVNDIRYQGSNFNIKITYTNESKALASPMAPWASQRPSNVVDIKNWKKDVQ